MPFPYSFEIFYGYDIMDFSNSQFKAEPNTEEKAHLLQQATQLDNDDAIQNAARRDAFVAAKEKTLSRIFSQSNIDHNNIGVVTVGETIILYRRKAKGITSALAIPINVDLAFE